jgi:hypothetical protein
MNVFVAVWSKGPGLALDEEAVQRLLPAPPVATASWRSHDRRVHILSAIIGPPPAGAQPIESGDGWGAVTDGILLPRDESALEGRPDWLLRHLRSLDGHRGFAGLGEYALAWSDGRSLYARSNVGCSHNLYIAETSHGVAISNRSVCLLGVDGVGTELDAHAVRWKAFQGYVGGRRTAFAAVRKLPNGVELTISPRGEVEKRPATVASLADPALRENFLRRPRELFENALDDLARYMARVHRALGAKPIDLPLSGGKDSRAIFALLLHAGLRDEIASIWTRGTLYSPEVLAAQDLCRAASFHGHEVRRPPHISPARVSAGTMVRTLDLGEGMLSLFDFCAIDPHATFRFQGHELGLRAGRFAKCRTASLEQFVEDALGTWSDPLGVGRATAELRSELRALFEEEHARGTPVEDLGDAYAVFHRLPDWAGVINAVDYCSGPISNPLLERRAVELAFSVPARFRRGELFHYLTLLHAFPPFLDVPFADQKWPPGLADRLLELGIDAAPRTPPPYRSRPFFPNLRNPYVPNFKLIYYRRMRPLMLLLLDKHRDFFEPLLDVEKLAERLRGVDDPSFQHLYVSLGVYSAILLREYGGNLFDRTRRADVVTDLQEKLDETAEAVGDEERSGDRVWLDLLERHERALAELMREAHGR